LSLGHSSGNEPGPLAFFGKLRSGTLYLVLGAPGSGAVWEVDLATGRSEQLTHPRSQYGVSSLSASSAGLVLADASSGQDVVSAYRDGRSVDIGGWGSDPDISPDGQVAYDTAPVDSSTTDRAPWDLEVVPVTGGHPRTLYELPGMGNPNVWIGQVWGPGGQLAVLEELGADSSEVVFLSPDGRAERKVRPVVGYTQVILWGPDVPDVVDRALNGGEELIAPDGEQTRLGLPANWVSRCLSPDGEEAIVTDARDDGFRVGVWHVGTSSHVQVLGILPSTMGINNCAWTSAPVPGT
jgi:hypothetical protein